MPVLGQPVDMRAQSLSSISFYCSGITHMYIAVQRQTEVTAHFSSEQFSSEQLLLFAFAFALQCKSPYFINPFSSGDNLRHIFFTTEILTKIHETCRRGFKTRHQLLIG